MLPYREKAFLEHLLTSEVLRFGSFKTKSGRLSPYFFNTGKFNSGAKIEKTAELYADLIADQFGREVDNLFGPAYKGIPLAVATSQILAKKLGRDITFTFNRKEIKDHGEGGSFIGYEYQGGEKVVVIEDVITGGTSINETMPLLKKAKVDVLGLVVGVDRQERGQSPSTAMEETRNKWGVRGYSLLTLDQIVKTLDQREFNGKTWIDHSLKILIDEYRTLYGPVIEN
jgi:orotate phosphoribosyltransferase